MLSFQETATTLYHAIPRACVVLPFVRRRGGGSAKSTYGGGGGSAKSTPCVQGGGGGQNGRFFAYVLVARTLMLNPCFDLERVACCENKFVDRLAWHKEETQHIEDYQRKLKNALNNIDLPIEALLCHDVMCCNPDHITDIDRYSNSITQTCLSAANGAIHHVGLLGNSSNRPIPGWSEFVEPACE